MPKKIERQSVTIRSQYGGVYGKRYGELRFRFEVDEQDLPDAIRAALYGKDRGMVAAISSNGTKYIIGRVGFGGLNIKPSGDSVLSLDTSLENLRLQMQALNDLVDTYVNLKVVVI